MKDFVILRKIVWIIKVSLGRRHKQSQKWLGEGKLAFSGEYGCTLFRALDEDAVMTKKVFLIMLVSLLLVSCGLRWEGQGPGPRDEGSPPKILASYAEQVVRPGETWKVYLRVRDVDCDMTYVVTDLWQSGGGSYPVSFTPISKHPCPELVGYVFLKTPADGDLVWEQFQARLYVRDRRGYRSNSIQLPLNFDQVEARKPPEQWRAATVVSIGTLNIENSTYRHHGTSGVRPVASGADGAKPVIRKAQSNRDAFSKMARKESIEK